MLVYCAVSDQPRLKEPYVRARCCRPSPPDAIVGYYSHDNVLKVHDAACANLAKAERQRLVTLVWDDILAPDDDGPGEDFADLDATDFAILAHHRDLGIDYSLKVAAKLNIDKQLAFDRHRKLRDMGLLQRVEPVMVQYRKGVVDNKWIKHRNHTYYELTDKGLAYLSHATDGPC
ncbi:DUF2250 domain-containing protein [candidate division GN15 bacterium]|nr:DUF2250 domain-containing protein [candidate division GN15 bacterium]